MSLQGSFFILIVAMIRMLWKRIPAKYLCFLWYLVGIRLTVPFSFDISLQSQPSNPIEEMIAKVANRIVYPYGQPKVLNTGGGWSRARRRIDLDLQDWMNITWIFVLLIILSYVIISFLAIRQRISEAVRYRDDIYYCENVKMPFLFGYFKPRIYISYNMSEEDIYYITEHERMHLKRRDHVSKIFGFLLVAVYWFNPIIWFGYKSFCEDLEYACDEMVINKLGKEHKKEYSKTLLEYSIEWCRELSPLGKCCFSDIKIKSRIKRILEYKSAKPVATVVLCILCILFISFGFMTKYNVKALIEVPLKGYDLYFGIPRNELEEAIKDIPYEVTKENDKYTYVLEGDFLTEFGKCQWIRLTVYDYGDLLTDLDGNVMDYGLATVEIVYSEGKNLYKNHILGKIERYYGNLEGGATEIGMMISKEDPKSFYDYYYSSKWKMERIPDMKEKLTAWYALRGETWPLIQSQKNTYMYLELVGKEGEGTRLVIAPYYLSTYLKLIGER